jgi:hypothetical protein
VAPNVDRYTSDTSPANCGTTVADSDIDQIGQ